MTRKAALFFALVVHLFVGVGCAPSQTPSVRILFIGNSYTFFNGGIDRILTDIAAQRGKTIQCETSTSPGKSLEWHYNDGNARQMIARGGWDWVVLQDFSLQPLEKRDLMFEYSRKFAALIKPTGAKLAFYMTWPRENEPQNRQAIVDAYSSIAREVGASVVPCGLAWQRVQQRYPDLKLYRPDHSHPTAEASYLNACCFDAVLLNDDPRGSPPPLIFDDMSLPRRLSESNARLLQEMAWETVQTIPTTSAKIMDSHPWALLSADLP